MDFTRFRTGDPDPATLREMTDQMQAAITALLASLRGLPAPAAES